MIRHPARHYIAYLFSKRGLSTAQIIEHLDDMRFPLPKEDKALMRFTKQLVDVRRRMDIPPNFDPTEKLLNAETISFLSEWQIFDMWRGDHFVGLAVDILNEPAMRRMLEALLLGPLSPQSIADRLGSRYGLDREVMNVRVVKAYAHYFWNAQSMNTAEWRTLVAHWLPDDVNNDYSIAIGAPRSSAGAAVVLAMVDRSADSLSPVQQYQAMRDHSFSLFMEHALLSTRPSLPRTQGAFMAFNMVRMADEELTKHRGGSADLLEEFKKIHTVYDASRLATVKDLPALVASNKPPIDVEPVEEPSSEDKEIV